MTKGFRRLRKSSVNFKILYIVILVSLCVVGVGYSVWNDTLSMNTEITSGNIDPVFVDQKGSDKKNVEYNLSEDGRTLDIIINKPDKGDTYDLEYVVKNLGSIPVEWGVAEPLDPAIIKLFGSPDNLLDSYGKNTGKGKLRVKVDSDEVIKSNIDFYQFNDQK